MRFLRAFALQRNTPGAGTRRNDTERLIPYLSGLYAQGHLYVVCFRSPE